MPFAIAVVGLLYDFRDEEKQISRAGWILLGLGSLSACLAVSLTVSEVRKAKKEDEHGAQQNDLILSQLDRTIRPITQLRLSFTIEISREASVVDSYVTRLSTAVEAVLPDLIDSRKALEEPNLTVASLVNGEASTIIIKRAPELWPHLENEQAIDTVASLPKNADDIMVPAINAAQPVRLGPKARTMILSVADGIAFRLPFSEARTRSGHYLTSFVFPENEDAFLALIDGK